MQQIIVGFAVDFLPTMLNVVLLKKVFGPVDKVKS